MKDTSYLRKGKSKDRNADVVLKQFVGNKIAEVNGKSILNLGIPIHASNISRLFVRFVDLGILRNLPRTSTKNFILSDYILNDLDDNPSLLDIYKQVKKILSYMLVVLKKPRKWSDRIWSDEHRIWSEKCLI